MAVTYRMQRSRVRLRALPFRRKNTDCANYRWHLSSKLLSRRSGPLKNPYKILHLCLGITFAPRLNRVEPRRHKMQTPSISIYAVAATFVALLAALLWYLSARRFRMASTSQELLDLFEERQAVLEEQATPSWSNDQGKASEFATAAASADLGPKAYKLGNSFARAFVSAEKATIPLSLRSFAADSKNPFSDNEANFSCHV